MIDVYVEGLSINIGRQGENLARNIYFDLSELINTYGEGTATLVYVRPSERAPYVCTTVRTGTFLIWSPTNTDTAFHGVGRCELRWTVGETLAKSIVYNTSIAPSIMSANQVPDPYLSWYDAIIAYIEANYAANGAPQEVREAIYTLLSKAAYVETGLTDELATVEAWAAANYTIRNNLTNVITNNNTGIVTSGSSYTATLTGATGYAVGSVTVTMGGEDVTSTVYSDGVITIAEVTGDVVITAFGVAAVVSLSAVYTQSGTVYDTAALADLKNDLVVTATYGDSSTAVIPGTDYVLSGTLATGTSTITVSYGGKTATFNVIVSERPATLQSISASFNQGSAVIYTDNSLNDLKPYLVVTARYSDSTTQTVTGYTLSGTLRAGTSTITASYGGKTATFNVTVTERVTPSADPIYTVTSGTVFNGTSDYLDTGLQLMGSNKSNVTIVFDVLNKSTLRNSSDNKVLLHCMHEVSPWPGICVQNTYYSSSSRKSLNLDVNSNTSPSTVHVENLPASTDGVREKFVGIINFQSGTMKLFTNINGTNYTDSNNLPSDINETNLTENTLIGCYQNASGTKGRYWKGTVYDLKIYDYAWTDTEAQAYLQEDHS